MKSLIQICNPLENGIYYSREIKVLDNGEPEKIYENIKSSIRLLQNNNENINWKSLYFELLSYEDYTGIIDDNRKNDINDNMDYYIDIVFENNNYIVIVAHKNKYGQKIECFRKSLVLNKVIEGNCIDDFINRGIEPLVDNIIDLKNSIKSRINDRIDVLEYHQTYCYEMDFSQIISIKEKAQKIIDNCNKQLENMSEKYTKIN